VTYIDERKRELAKCSKAALINDIINDDLNRFVGHYAEVPEGDADPHGHGKRVPYIGWFWRSVDFANGVYYIGNCGEFVGFMENNKWGYPERRLTPDEASRVTDIVCEAYRISHAGGNAAEIVRDTKAKLDELWDLLQSFPMTTTGFWIYGPMGNVGFADTEEDAERLIAALSSAGDGLPYRMVPA
jgi:hypothetical protein